MYESPVKDTDWKSDSLKPDPLEVSVEMCFRI